MSIPRTAREASRRTADRTANRAHRKKGAWLALAFILVLQALVCLWFSLQKSGLFMDESFTYTLANGVWGAYPSTEGVVYEHAEPWVTQASVGSFLGIDLKQLYLNQAADTHPPLYYVLFSLAYSLFPGSVSPLIGCVLNSTLLVVGTALMYAISRELGMRKAHGLVVCALWAINPAMVNMAIYLRMYAMLSVVVLAATLACLKVMRRGACAPVAAAAIFALTVGGFLTQYFFVFYAFALYLICGVTLLARKRLASAGAFAAATIGGIACAIALFPPSLTHLFSNRGQQAIENASSAAQLVDFLPRNIAQLNSGIFGGMLVPLLALTALLGIGARVGAHLGNRRSLCEQDAAPVTRGAHLAPAEPKAPAASQGPWLPGLLTIACSSAFYVAMVSYVAPYASIRYLMPAEQALFMSVWCSAIAALAALLSALDGTRRNSHPYAQLAGLAAVGIACTVLGYHAGIKYLHQDTPSLAELSSKNASMLVVSNEPIFQDSLLPDAVAYERSLCFTAESGVFDTYDLAAYASSFALYVPLSSNADTYLGSLTRRWPEAVATYCGEAEENYGVYDVTLNA